MLRDKISLNPDIDSFLLIYFSPKPQFYQISTNEKAFWRIISRKLKPNSSEIQFAKPDKFKECRNRIEKKSLTASTSSSESRYSKNKANIEADCTEKMILKQNLMLKSLEKQINDLQHVLTDSQLINAETNTTNYFNLKESQGENCSYLKGNRRRNENHDYTRMISTMRNSCFADFGRSLPDTTIDIPKIIYVSDNESCDEDSSYELKYLA